MFMSGYVVSTEMNASPQNLTTTYKTLARLVQAATLMKRSRTFEMEVSATGVPNATDCPIQVSYMYCSAAGAGTPGATVVAQPLDAGVTISNIDLAVTLTPVNFSAEPTTYAIANTYWSRAFNQRSGVLWQSAPGREIYSPAAASVGPGLKALSPNYASTCAAKIMFDEI
jgi:hypothetical protein